MNAQVNDMIKNYNDFVNDLLSAGFSMGGGNDEGIYAVVPWSWNQDSPYKTPVHWHTGDAETDPWEWRIRVLDERDDIAYGKLFFKKSGFIARKWYPYFLAVRRGGIGFDETYSDGKISHYAKRIYDVISTAGSLPTEETKRLGGFDKEEKSKFDSALTDLQMRMFLTTDGRRNKRNNHGEEYGWASATFCTTERFWEHTDVFTLADKLSEADAFAAIREQVLSLNPTADEKKVRKFAYGR